MHQLVIMTALSASAWMYGGGGCQTGHCGPSMGYSSSPGPMYVVSAHFRGYVCPTPPCPVPMAAPAPQFAPAPQVAPAPQAYPSAPTAQRSANRYPSYYFPATPTSPNVNVNGARR